MVSVPEGLQTAAASQACCLPPIVLHDNCIPTKHIRGRVSGQRWWGGQHFRHSNKTLAHLIHTAWRVCYWETVGVITNRVNLPDGTLLVTKKVRLVSHHIYFSTTAHISSTVPPSRSVAASKVSKFAVPVLCTSCASQQKIWIICTIFCNLGSEVMLNNGAI